MYGCRKCNYDLCAKCNGGKVVNCAGKHGLVKFPTPQDGWYCSKCDYEFPKGTMLYGCRKCDYDLCAKCNGNNVPNCKGRHGLSRFVTTGHDNTFGCDICKARFPSGTVMYGCRKCNYDACTKCYI